MLADLIRRLDEWRRIRDGVARLNQFDDRLLADMGINRDEIVAFARGELRRQTSNDISPPARVAISSPHPRIARSRPGGAYHPVRQRTVTITKLEQC